MRLTRKMKSFQNLLILAAVCISKVKSMEGAEGSIPIFVLRRFATDYYSTNGTYYEVSCDNGHHINNTYLVHDRLCVTEEELYRKACSSSIVPSSGNKTTAVAILDSRTPNITHLKLDTDGQELFKFNETDQPVNNSFCHIASLEVFRGWEQAIQISHSGFSLTRNGSIEINKNKLAYRVDDFIGELYRMNIACSNDALPERGCLFFKVLRNTSVTNAKFDCTVPGTLYDFSEECNITTAEEAVLEITSSTTVSTVTSITTATTNSNATDLINVFIPVVVLIGLALATATVIIIVTCYRTYTRRSRVIRTQADVFHRESDSRMDQHAHLDLQTEITEDINDMELEGNPSYDKLNRGLPVTRAQTQGTEHNYEEVHELESFINYEINPAYSIH